MCKTKHSTALYNTMPRQMHAQGTVPGKNESGGRNDTHTHGVDRHFGEAVEANERGETGGSVQQAERYRGLLVCEQICGIGIQVWKWKAVRSAVRILPVTLEHGVICACLSEAVYQREEPC